MEPPYANVPNTFKDGDTLSAQSMNANFTALDQRITQLETTNARMTVDGGYSLGATFCGKTGGTSGDLSALSSPGTGYAKARAACQSQCVSPTAHMCTADEIIRTQQTSAAVMPSGWYSDGTSIGGGQAHDCAGWTSASAATTGGSWSTPTPQDPSSAACNATYDVLCCN